MRTNYYQPPSSQGWQGRTDHPEDQQQWRLHQIVQPIDLSQAALPTPSSPKAFALLGYASDAGVARNQGRLGAAAGPDYIRRFLASLPLPNLDMQLLDLGNISSPQADMEGAQAALGEALDRCLAARWQPIVLGGGHEVAYGHYLGLRKHLSTEKRIGIINFDAHLDMRELVEGAGNSGTPFYQIALAKDENFAYLPIGIRPSANTAHLLHTASRLGVSPIFIDELLHGDIAESLIKIRDFAHSCGFLQITIDMDGFPQSISPGVSAPGAIGLSPAFVIRCLDLVRQSGKAISYDIAETNPTYDIDGQTGRLAAELIWQMMR